MGYRKIPNLYQDQTILLFKECYALEKVHGTSARVGWHEGQLRFSAGGANHERFVALFDETVLREAFRTTFGDGMSVVVYGEAYDGKMQRMDATYGPELRFIAFEVRVGDYWLAVPQAEDVVTKLGLEFVPYVRVPATVEALDAERDRPSVVAERRGMGTDRPREGVVLRPLIELTLNNQTRLLAKHKGDEFRETASPRVVGDPAALLRLHDAEAIAMEWVTPMRLQHVLDKLPGAASGLTVADTGAVVHAMVADVLSEAGAEIEDTPAARKAIGRAASALFHKMLRRRVAEESGR